MKEFEMLKKKNFLTLLLTKESTEHVEDLNTSLKLFIFLLRYSSLLTDTPPKNNFLKRQFPLPGDISTQNPNGARYLDPKYSRWISTDPALGEYIPAAGKGNSENAGNLPGMGGIYNHINGDLYHYAGNNPVRYVDPDGRMFNNSFEKEFVYQVLGVEGLFAYNSSIILPIPNNLRSGSFIGGFVFYDWNTFVNPMANDMNTFIHELFHQIQYNSDFVAFPKLIQEYALNNQMAKNGSIIGAEKCYRHDGSYYYKYIYDGNTIDNYTYQYSKLNLSEYKTLSDLPFYEAQAQFVGDYAEQYFNARFGKLENPDEDKIRLKQMARIMKSSGYEDTEAVRWILNDMK